MRTLLLRAAVGAVALAVLLVLLGWAMSEPAPARKVTWRTAQASVYDSSPMTASGRHATYMVAHKTLRFGTRVRVCYRRCVTAVVLDRGPYIAGREFDLNFAVMRATGFPYGTGTVRWRIR